VLKAKIKGVSGGHLVAMVTCYIKWITAACLPMTGNLYDTVVVASLVKQWWCLSFKVFLLEKCWKQLKHLLCRRVHIGYEIGFGIATQRILWKKGTVVLEAFYILE